jgi:hypothetical protein
MTVSREGLHNTFQAFCLNGDIARDNVARATSYVSDMGPRRRGFQLLICCQCLCEIIKSEFRSGMYCPAKVVWLATICAEYSFVRSDSGRVNEFALAQDSNTMICTILDRVIIAMRTSTNGGAKI